MSEYKTFVTYLQGKIQRARNANLKEREIMLSEILIKYKGFHKPVEFRIEGWKGKDEISIWQNFDQDFTVIEHSKEKETGEVKEHKTVINKEDVNNMLEVIRKLPLNGEYKCYAIAKKLGWEWKELWKERKIYFKIYYYPLKVLEHLGVVTYFGRGSVMRIK